MQNRPEFPSQRVGSVKDLLDAVERDTSGWHREGNVRPWFRGQADAGDPPLPSVLREPYDQVRMTLTFRNRAPAYHPCPEQTELVEWLSLMQHYRLPTRLLDWTESPLIACLFAVEEALRRREPRPFEPATADSPPQPQDMGVWVIHPIELNKLSGIHDFQLAMRAQCRTLENFKFAFGTAGELTGLDPTDLPLAVQVRHLDMRMAGQQSVFTVHGADRRNFEELLRDTTLVREGFFRKYVMSRSLAAQAIDELDQLGISYTTLYPDLEGLATQLTHRFRGEPSVPIRPPFVWRRKV